MVAGKNRHSPGSPPVSTWPFFFASATSRATLSNCMRFCTGPSTFFSSMPSPIGTCFAKAARCSHTSSWMLACTYRRFMAAQVWPLLRNAPQNRPSAMALGSASGSTMPASLPPSSSVSRFMVLAADCITFLPVAQEPVNTILRMTGSLAMSAPRLEVRSSQLTLLTTPSGSTSLSSSTKRSVASGV
ncbi:hypothetical protein D3C72_1371750 [compost metagenome]